MKQNVKKQIRDFEVDYDFDWSEKTTITEVLRNLLEIKKLGGNKICVDYNHYYDGGFMTFKAYQTREEDDGEYRRRKNKENMEARNLERKELAELKRLQEKYLKNK